MRSRSYDHLNQYAFKWLAKQLEKDLDLEHVLWLSYLAIDMETKSIWMKKWKERANLGLDLQMNA